MRHRSASQTQRTRRLLSQEALKRCHRRGEFARLVFEDDTPSSSSQIDEGEATGAPTPVSRRT
jgi:hypothetical protein